MQFIKKHIKEILIVILLLFGMQKCTQSCNRQGEINNLEVQYRSLDSIYNVQVTDITNLQKDTSNYLDIIRMYQKFDNQRNMIDSINALNISKQHQQTQELVNQNRKLINKLQDGQKD